MLSLRSHKTTLLAASVGLLAIIGSVLLRPDAQVVGEASESETEFRVEVDDIDDLDDIETVLSPGISLASTGSTSRGFEFRHESPLVAHLWRWCSRGPPLADC
jgi:hypothetical protein